MFTRRKWREIVRRLDRIENTLLKITDELERGEILHGAQNDKVEVGVSDQWLQEGLNNIMAFQAGGKKGEKE